MSIKPLNNTEIEQVSGGLLGDALISAVYGVNNFLNSPSFSTIGQTVSAVGLKGVHQVFDLLVFQIPSVAAITVGKILGGTDNQPLPLHYDKEYGQGLYR